MFARNHGMRRGFLPALALAVLLPALGQTAFAQLVPGAQAPATRGAAPALSPPPPATMAATPTIPASQPPNATTPAVAVSPGWGLCQCIGSAKDSDLDFSCPGSPQACQSTCGNQYSFKPDAACRRAAQ
jgi:hypothetical protein